MTLHRIDYNGGEIWVDKDTRIPNNYKGWCWQPHWCKPVMVEPSDGYNLEVAYAQEDQREFGGGIIKAQSPNLSLPNIPYVEIEEDIEQLAIEFSQTKDKHPNDLIEGFIAGYKAASAKKYTLDDIHKAVDLARKEPRIMMGDIVESLQPKVVSINVGTTTEWWDGVLNCWVAAEDDDTQHSRVVPVTYTRDGKTFLKVKKNNYE